MNEFLTWGVPIFIGLALYGLAYSTLQTASSSGDFWMARFWFSLGTIVIFARFLFWGINAVRPQWIRVSVCALMAAVLVGVTVESLRSISHKQREKLSAAAARKSNFSVNIIPLGVDDSLDLELDRREVFRLSQHDFALRAITAKFVNQSKPQSRADTAEKIGARIQVYETDHLDAPLLEIDHVCWLGHETPFIDFEPDAPERIVLGVFEPKFTQGFEPRITFYENHRDRNVPLTRHPYGIPYEHLSIKVILNGLEYWYEVALQYGTSVKTFVDGDKALGSSVSILQAWSVSQVEPSDKIAFLKQLGAFRDEGNDLLQRLSIHRVLVPYEQEFETWRKKVQDYLDRTIKRVCYSVSQ